MLQTSLPNEPMSRTVKIQVSVELTGLLSASGKHAPSPWLAPGLFFRASTQDSDGLLTVFKNPPRYRFVKKLSLEAVYVNSCLISISKKQTKKQKELTERSVYSVKFRFQISREFYCESFNWKDILQVMYVYVLFSAKLYSK